MVILLAGCGETSPEWMQREVPVPKIFAPDVISTSGREYGIAFTVDGLEAYFTRRSRRGPSRIFVSRYEGGRWTTPHPADFGVERDEAPFISGDGSTMLFASRRPVRGSWDRSENIWVMRRTGDGWSRPSPLPGTVNQPRSDVDGYPTGTESGPYLSSDGLLLYASRADATWGSDLYVATSDAEGNFSEARPLTLNTEGEEESPVLSPDGQHLIFQAYRDAKGVGDRDLYVSKRTRYGWTEPRPFPEPINSPHFDGHPSFSPDGRHFFFASDRSAGRGFHDIYVVSTEALGLTP